MISKFSLLVLSQTFESLVDLLLDILQYLEQFKEMPKNNLLTKKEFNEATSYEKSNLLFSMVYNVFSLFKTIFFLYNLTALYNQYGNKWSGKNLGKWGFFVDAEVLFNILLSQAENFIDLPFDLFYDFVLENFYGFNKKTLWTFSYVFVM